MIKHRFLIGILVLLVLFISVGGTVIYAAEAAVVFRMSDAECKPGEQIHVSVTVTSTEEINSIALYDLVYDPSVLTFAGFDNYSDIESQCMFPGGLDEDRKTIILALRKTEELNTYICDIRFTVNPDAVQTETLISAKTLTKKDAAVIPSALEGGTVRVQSTVVPHVHQMVYVAAAVSDCRASGNVAYWHCSSCGKNYMDRTGGSEIADVTLPRSTDRHDGGVYVMGTREATEYSFGYTGDLYCQGCGTMLQKGEILPRLTPANPIIPPEQPVIPVEPAPVVPPPTVPDPPAEEDPPENKPSPIDVLVDNITWENPFTDITESDPYYKAVQCMYVNKLFRGISNSQFGPEMTMTRAMFVTVLGRLAGVEEDYSAQSCFSDVESGAWYAPYVDWAAEYGIINGYGDGTFGVQDEITVEQAAVIIARYAEYAGSDTASDVTLIQYNDSPEVSSWADAAMCWAIESGIFKTDGYLLHAKDPAVRARVAGMLYAYILQIP